MSIAQSTDTPLFDALRSQMRPLIGAPFNDDTARARLTDPVTSHAAADSISVEGLQESQAFVLVTLRESGALPAWRIERLAFGEWSGSRIRTALTELEAAGLITRYSKSARNAKDSLYVDLFEAVA